MSSIEQFDPIAATREFPMLSLMQPTLKGMAQKILFDEKRASEVLPKLEVIHMWCPRSTWYCVYGMIETERQYKEHIEQGHKVRPIRFIELEGANHLVSPVFSVHHHDNLILHCRFTGTIQKTSGLRLSMP
jgi:hypothetical protein